MKQRRAGPMLSVLVGGALLFMLLAALTRTSGTPPPCRFPVPSPMTAAQPGVTTTPCASLAPAAAAYRTGHGRPTVTVQHAP